MSRFTGLLRQRLAPCAKGSRSGGSSLFNHALLPGAVGRLLAVLVVLLSAGAISASAQVVIRERVELKAPQQGERPILLDQGYGQPLPDFWYEKYGKKPDWEGNMGNTPYASKTSGESPVHLRWDYDVQGFVVEGGSGQLGLYFGGTFFAEGYPLNAKIRVSVSGASSYAVEVPAGRDRFEQTWTPPDPAEDEDEECPFEPRFRLHQWTNPPFEADEFFFFQWGYFSRFNCAAAADPATPWVDIGPVEEGDVVRVDYSGAGRLLDGGSTDSEDGEGPEGVTSIGREYWCPRGERSYREVSWSADFSVAPCDKENVVGFIGAVFSVKADPVGLDHFEISFDPTPLPYQKIASVFVQAKDVDGNNVELADNTPLTITLTGGSHLGSLRRSIIGGANTTLETTYGAVKPNGGASGIVFFADGENAATLPEDERVVEVTVEKTGEVERRGRSSLEVSGDYEIELTVAPGDILHGREAILQVQSYDSDGLPVDLAGDTPIDFTLSASGQELGSLSWNGVSGASVTGVPYNEARAWKVRFIADGERREELVSMQVFAKAPSGSKSGVSLDVDGRWVLYKQKDPRWAAEKIGHSSLTISDIGCAVSVGAMMSSSLGFQVNPGQLNEWMKYKTVDGEKVKRLYEEGGFYGERAMNWNAIEAYSDNKVEVPDRYGSRMLIKKKVGDRIVYTPNFENTSSSSSLDSYLDRGYIVGVQVYNKESRNTGQHWVFVIGKTDSGRYKINDPGRKEFYLDGYGEAEGDNRFWGYVPVRVKPSQN